MNLRLLRICTFTFTAILMFAGHSASAAVCIIGECSEMTNEFRTMELRPKTIALLPARSTLTEDGVFNSEEHVGETAELEESLAKYLRKEMEDLGYEVRVVTNEEINADPDLTLLVNDADQRFDEEYNKIVAFKISSVKYRRYTIGEPGRILAHRLGVDAVAFPRMQAIGASGTAKTLSIIKGQNSSGRIYMEFGLVHARTGDVEAFFGAINQGGMFGKSLSSILKKPDKHMKGIAETATKKMPKVGKSLKAKSLDADKESRELVLYDEVDENAVFDDLEGLLDEE
jgi:hypothetical protein